MIYKGALSWFKKKNKQKKKQPLFTLGSVYSTSASGAEQTIETNNSNIT